MEELLRKLTYYNVNVKVVGGNLKLNIPNGLDLKDILEEVKTYKQELIAYVKERTKMKSGYHLLGKSPDKEYYPLSSAQKRLYFLYAFDQGSLAYNMPQSFLLRGDIEKDRLQDAFAGLIHRHEILRTSFEIVAEEPVQRITAAGPFSLEYFQSDEQSSGEIIKEFIRPFDLSAPPLLRAGLIRLTAGEHILLIDMPHLVSDGVSETILVKDFMALYKKEALPVLRLQYKDYACWQQGPQGQAMIAAQRAFWQHEFSQAIIRPDLPLDFMRSPANSQEGGTLSFRIDAAETAILKQIARAEEATLFMVLLSVYAVMLSKLSNQSDIVIGIPVAGRQHADLDNMMGMFVNMLSIRTFPESGLSFRGFLSAVRAKTLACFDNQDYPYEDLINDLQQDRDLSRSPLFDVIFAYDNFEGADLVIPGLELTRYQQAYDAAKFDLTLSAGEDDKGMLLRFNYATALFTKETIGRFAAYFSRIVHIICQEVNAKEGHSITTDAGRRLAAIDILGPEERQELLAVFNRTDMDYPRDRTLTQLFEQQAAKSPDNIALFFGDLQLRYRSLNERANQLAGYLQDRGVGPGSLVGLLIERSMEMIIAILGILKAGGAYLPLDSSYPQQRVLQLLHDGRATLLLTERDSVQVYAPHIATADVRDRVIDDYDTADPGTGPSIGRSIGPCIGQSIGHSLGQSSEDLAYVLYTSGSTGKPKGVMIRHRSVVNLICFLQKEYGIGPQERILQFSTICFDASVEQIWLALLSGAGLVLIDRETMADNGAFNRYLSAMEVTHFHATPSFLESIELQRQRSLRRIIAGGEWLPASLAAKLGRDYALYNEYGPTETTITSVKGRVSGELPEGAVVPIGRPVGNTQIYILDSAGSLVPVGVKGEMFIGGEGLALGYLNEEEVTRGKFIPNPFIEGKLMYRTGDLCRWQADGRLVYEGRTDEQVKIRGFRIELGEIASQLTGHAQVAEAAVLVQARGGESCLVAYYVPSGTVTETELKTYLLERLPAYMVPSAYIRLESLPLTLNGKLDKKALPAPAEEAGPEYKGPSDPVEEKLVTIWSDLLQMEKEKISVTASFFELGGHSLKTIRLTHRIYKEFQVQIGVKEIFKLRDIEQIARVIREGTSLEYIGIEQAPDKEYYPLSSAQKRLYFLYAFDQGSLAYNMPQSFLLRGDIEKDRLQDAFAGLIHRHEILRTSFEIVAEEPVQRITAAGPFSLEYFQSDEQSSGEIIKEFIRPFDLSAPPLLRAGLIRLTAGEHILLIDMPHLVSDGVSEAILVKDFMALYKKEALPVLRLQYKDYACWQQGPQGQAMIAAQRAFWQHEFLQAIIRPDLPLDFMRSRAFSQEGGTLHFRIDAAETAILKQIARTEEATLFMVLLSVYAVLLSKLSNQSDIVIGIPVAGRQHADLDNMMGMFVNMLSIRTFPESGLSFRGFLSAVRAKTLACFDNQDYPYEDLINDLQQDRDLSRSPLFDVIFAYDNFEGAALVIPGLELTRYQQAYDAAKFDLTLSAGEDDKGILLRFNYATALFTKETIGRFAAYFSRIVHIICQEVNAKEGHSITTDAGRRLAAIDILGPEERQELLTVFNRTDMDYPRDRTLTQLFEQQAAKSPDNIALFFGDLQLRYRSLNERANQLAGYLQDRGVGPGSLVGLLIERSMEMIIAILGILKAGGAYLPLDSSYPQQRVLQLLHDGRTTLLLTEKDSVQVYAPHIATADIRDRVIDDYDTADPGTGPSIGRSIGPCIGQSIGHSLGQSSEDLAYVLYTSGSTGKPKGVMIRHRSVVNLICFLQKEYGIGPQERILQFSTICFDASVEQIWLALLSGAGLVLIDRETMADNGAFNRYLSAMEVTHLDTTPSFLESIELQGQHSLRRIIAGGEWLPASLAAKLGRDYALYNEYGPTETTITSVKGRVSGELPEGAVVPIGRPVGNTQIYILDSAGSLVPVGVKGEMFIGGEGLALGYLKEEEVTREKFIPNPFIEGKLMYRTGDLCRWQADGRLVYEGRTDEQVKIRGFRIELGEIASQLTGHAQVAEAAVLARVKGGESCLVAYYVSSGTVTETELKTYLLERLPAYMVPSAYIRLESLPLTLNGKLDKKALPAPAEEAGPEYKGPSDPVEEKLVTIWSDLLQMEKEKISVTASFFELGGHSLKTIRLMHTIYKEFMARIALVDIFHAPTIMQQALAIRQAIKGFPGRNDRLLLLKQQPVAASNIFFIHDGSGDVQSYTGLCELIKNDHCWGIQRLSLDRYGLETLTVQEMAREYVEIIKTVQPAGPYWITGWSLGGLIAYEMVKLLEATGSPVANLLMIDSPIPEPEIKKEQTPGGVGILETDKSLIFQLIGHRPEVLENTRSNEELWRQAIPYFKDKRTGLTKIKNSIPQGFRALIPRLDEIDTEELVIRINIIRTLENAGNKYFPAGKIKSGALYIKAQETHADVSRLAAYFQGTLVITEMPGDHYSILQQPLVCELAEKLNSKKW